MENKKTVGQISKDLREKDILPSHSANDQMQESLTDYDSNIYECIQRGLKDYADDFYIVVVTKKERLMPNVLRNYFLIRLSCPTPTYDQVLYKYDRSEERIEFIWVIPSAHACQELLNNALNIDQSQKELLSFVIDFVDGTLDRKAMILNGEIEPLIMKH